MPQILQVGNSSSPDMVDMLKKNVIGTPGISMLYQHLEVEGKISNIASPYFVHLKRNESILGTCCFCKRDTINNHKIFSSFYIRYFSFQETYRRNSITRRRSMGSSALRNEITELLNGAPLGINSNQKFFHYAYVDPRNLRSAELCKEFGFETVRQYATVIVSRMHPTDHPSIQKVKFEDHDELKSLLTAYYAEHSMFSYENLLNRNDYYIVKDFKNQILAGTQATPEHWKIHSMPGLTGKLAMHVFPHLPYLKKLFNPDFRFLTLDGVYCAPGQESALQTLIEGLLARHNVNAAFIITDANSKHYQRVRTLNLGLISKLTHEVRGNVICRFHNFSNSEKRSFTEHPAYISAIDVT